MSPNGFCHGGLTFTPPNRLHFDAEEPMVFTKGPLRTEQEEEEASLTVGGFQIGQQESFP